jgi:hypothetical protein
MSVIGVISTSLLPETFEQSLPETLDDADDLGREANFLSFLPPDYKEARKRHSATAQKFDYTNDDTNA